MDRRLEGRSSAFGARGCVILLGCVGIALGASLVVSSASSITSFAAKSYRAGSVPVSVEIGDLNGDAKPDLVTANYDSNTVSVLLNPGDGSFESWSNYATGKSPRSVAVGDLNGDGKLDLVTANGDANSVSVLVNTGDGT